MVGQTSSLGLISRLQSILALKSLGKQFLSGYIALAEGEKDPRNLMVAFTVVRVLLIEFDISEHVEVSHGSNSCFNDE